MKCVHQEPDYKAENIHGCQVKSKYGPIGQAPREGGGLEGANFRRMTLVAGGKRKEVGKARGT